MLLYLLHHRSCFQHYILQDAFFLNYYAKTYAAALDKCRAKPQHIAIPKPFQATLGAGSPQAASLPTGSPPHSSHTSEAAAAAAAAGAASQQPPAGHLSDCKAVLLQLLLGVHIELRMHGAYAAKWGVTLEEGLRPSAATSAYTNFLTDIAHDPQVRAVELYSAGGRGGGSGNTSRHLWGSRHSAGGSSWVSILPAG